MTLELAIQYKRPPAALRKYGRRAAKAAGFATVVYWHRTYLPRHFETQGSRTYNYDGRSPAYNKRKRRRYGHARPLVFTGHGSRAAKRSIRPVGSSRRVRGRMPGTQVFNFGGTVNGGGTSRWMPPMREEMTRVTPREMSDLVVRYKQAFNAEIRKLSGRTTRVRPR